MRRRIRVTIVVVVVGIVTGVGTGLSATWRTLQAAAHTSAAGAADRQVPVVLTAPRRMVFESRLVVAGNVQAQRYALVSARMPGPLDAVYVDEGDWVEAGKTKMFQTDSLKLIKAVAMAQQGLRVAELSVREKQASLEQVLADQEQVQLDLKTLPGVGTSPCGAGAAGGTAAVACQAGGGDGQACRSALGVGKHAPGAGPPDADHGGKGPGRFARDRADLRPRVATLQGTGRNGDRRDTGHEDRRPLGP